MRKLNNRVMRIVMLVSVMCLSLFAAACKDDTADYAFEGLSDIHISQTVTEYDFKEGVTGLYKLSEKEFTADSSAVRFGTAGEYEVKYTMDKYTAARKVYVYGTPAFSVVKNAISYEESASAEGIKKAVSAKDSFGNVLDVTLTQGISAGDGGYIEYGEHEVKFKTEDRTGNKAEFTCTLTVSDSDKPQFENLKIDLADVEQAFEFSGASVSAVFFEDVKLTSDDYNFINGWLRFSEGFIVSKELGDYDLRLVTSKGYNDTKLIIADEKPANFSFSAFDTDYAESVVFDAAKLNGHQRDVTFEYAVKDSANKTYDVTVADGKISFVPKTATEFTVTVTAKRGTETAGSKECDFVLHDDVYAWAVNPENNYSQVYFPETVSGEYSAEQSYGDYNGSVHLVNTRANTAGDIALRLYHRPNIPAGSSLIYYIYNPTGVELTSYIYTDNGWWLSQLGGILTDKVTIPAEKGWHKVVLTLVPGFDGTFSGFTAKPEESSDARFSEIRITTADWSYSGSEPNFNVYVSNIYLEKTRGEGIVEYEETGYNAIGVKNISFKLPHALSDDGRVTFEYALKKGTDAVNFDETAFTFTPAAAGEYTFTVTGYWRDDKISEKTYTFNIEDDFALPVAAYYRYDAQGKVTLPEAIIASDITGKTVEYSITPAGGEKVVLGADRVYTTTANGEYVYRAEIKNGTVVERFIEKNIKIHDGRVLLDCGISGDNVNSDLVVVPATQHSFAPEVAAPGELGSLKIDNANFSEKGNFWVGLTKYLNGSSVTQLVFWIKHTGSEPLSVRMYSPATGTYSNYWYKNTQYTVADGVQPITGSNEWQKIEFNVYADALTTNDIRLQFTTDTSNQNNMYPWTAGEAPVIYISNFYYR